MMKLRSIAGAAALLGLIGTAAAVQAQAPAAAAAQAPVATPMMGGHPDLSGYWGRAGGGGGLGAVPVGTTLDLGAVAFRVDVPARKKDFNNFENDSGVTERAETNKPMYKPEFWAKVRDADRRGNLLDPVFHCMPAGVPRMGPPGKIVQTAQEVILLYPSMNVHRIIPVDGRARDDIRAHDQTWYGDALGHWEGDTLVVETMGFNDVSWLGWAGYVHSTDLKVIEKFHRVGNEMRYDVTVEDPTMLLEPWVWEETELRLNPDIKRAQFLEDLPCDERDLDQLADPEKRG